MPSINYCVDLDSANRIRVNACEGQYHLAVEYRNPDSGAWKPDYLTMMTKPQVQALRDQLNRALEVL